MHFEIVNALGITVRLLPTSLALLTVRQPNAQLATDVNPMMEVPAELLEHAKSEAGLDTRVFTLEGDGANFGVIAVRSQRAASVFVCDLGESVVQSWIATAARKRYLAIGLVSDKRTSQLRVVDASDIGLLEKRCNGSRKASFDELGGAFVKVLDLLDDPSTLERIGLRPDRHRTVSVALMGDMASSADNDSSGVAKAPSSQH